MKPSLPGGRATVLVASLSFTPTTYRSHEAGALRLSHAGEHFGLSGWVQTIRRFRRVVFVELKEASELIQLVMTPLEMMGEAFDLIMNGMEIGGGSMRIHEVALQRRVFAHLGMNAEESELNFRPLLEALQLGAPPHGGMALGVERLVATLLGLPHIRSVMAFPKTTGGQCLLTEALS